MGEWEKMQQGLPYFDYGEDIFKIRHSANHYLRLFNQTTHNDADTRIELLKKIVADMKEGSRIMPPFQCEFGKNIYIGKDTFINHNCIAVDGGRITIGNNVLIGPRVSLFTVNHPLLPEQRRLGICIGEPITIGNDCWIGGDVTISPGTTIGNNCVIGCGSVVVHDIPDNSLAVGNPCKVLRSITEADSFDLSSMSIE